MKTMHDINWQFNEYVTEYLKEGYMIDPISMAGHQGEEGKVNLIKGESLIMILMTKDRPFTFEDGVYTNDYTWFVEIREWEGEFHHGRPLGTVWNDRSTVIKSTKFYQIGESRTLGKLFTQDLDEALEVQEKRYQRYVRSNDKYLISFSNDTKRLELASKYLKRARGYKRVSYNHLSVVKSISQDRNHACYRVSYGNDVFTLR